MDLKKFKKITNSNEKIKKVDFFHFKNVFKYLKVLKVINYYTLEVAIYNNDKLNIWYFILNDVDILDDRLTDKNKQYMAKTLTSLAINSYFPFQIKKVSSNKIYGTIFDTTYDYNVTLNTTLINLSINLSIIRDKMKKNALRGGVLDTLINSGLPTIYEE